MILLKKRKNKKNIDQELENWKDLKSKLRKDDFRMIGKRTNKIETELEENQKNPEQNITKGQNIQNLENTKKKY